MYNVCLEIGSEQLIVNWEKDSVYIVKISWSEPFSSDGLYLDYIRTDTADFIYR